ncbi:hypothetical protein QR46_3580 [Giardia duodenalis assemblage B]|uniref:Uncharacterized protein n=3 Tax=Giardia intestinalis TaxID=5741 RepID=A0A132NQY2_GIAIN|nr:Hypothetical protein GL50581_2543 [Giardia intestinalis ATCC 50581]ESU41955.1 Hypothetical protein GSB_3114 [Giardia intestinalis]KWX12440.1 hypothetical protein QR46_3580 [Giardia intestinalis assemblage B]
MDALLQEVSIERYDAPPKEPIREEDELYTDFLDREGITIGSFRQLASQHYNRLSQYIFELEHLAAYGELQLSRGFLIDGVSLPQILCHARNESLTHFSGLMTNYFKITKVKETFQGNEPREAQEISAALRHRKFSWHNFIYHPIECSPALVELNREQDE